MTRLTKPVTRWATLPRGEVAVTLDPAGVLTFREKGRRKVFMLPLAEMFARAVDRMVQSEKAERKAERKWRSMTRRAAR